MDEQQRRQLDEQGYLIFKNVLSPTKSKPSLHAWRSSGQRKAITPVKKIMLRSGYAGWQILPTKERSSAGCMPTRRCWRWSKR